MINLERKQQQKKQQYVRLNVTLTLDFIHIHYNFRHIFYFTSTYSLPLQQRRSKTNRKARKIAQKTADDDLSGFIFGVYASSQEDIFTDQMFNQGFLISNRFL